MLRKMTIALAGGLSATCSALVFANGTLPVNPQTPPPWGWPNGQHNGFWSRPPADGVDAPNNWEGADSSSAWSVSFNHPNNTKASLDGNGLMKYTYTGDALDAGVRLVLTIKNSFDPDKHKNIWIHWSGSFGSASSWHWEIPEPAGPNWIKLSGSDALTPGTKTDSQGFYQNYSLSMQPAVERIVFDLSFGNSGPPGVITFGDFYYSTQCVPSSGALTVLALGGIVAHCRRRV